MERRITGTEMEWGLVLKRSEEQKNFHTAEKSQDLLTAALDDELLRIDSFLSNGARYYMDIGAHPEYATPEDDTIEGTLANEIAGERITLRGLERAKEQGKIYDFRLNKRLIDTKGETWGHHENFSANARKLTINEESLALLGLHLATVNIFTGAGMVRQSPGNRGKFSLAQKVHHLTGDYSQSTTQNSKPLVNLRDDPECDASKYLRVHVTSGDANISPWAIRMRLGTISMVVGLMEHNYIPLIHTEEPLHVVAQKIAGDLTLAKPIRLANGKLMRPLEIQGEIMIAASKLSQEVQLSADELLVLDEWERAIEDAAKDPELLMDRADWAAKKRFLERYMDKKGINWGHPKMPGKDRQFDEIGPNGAGLKLRDSLWAQWMPPEDLISLRETTPPEGTRAHLRGRFISRFANSPDETSVEWGVASLNGSNYKMSDPFATKHKFLDRVIDRTPLSWKSEQIMGGILEAALKS